MTRYLRRRDLAARYSCSEKTIDRMVDEDRLPKPIYQRGSRFPLWREDLLDKHDSNELMTGTKPVKKDAKSAPKKSTNKQTRLEAA
jgi:hypothetical protein